REKMEEWMIKSGIELNNPKVPEGFKSQLDCKNRPMYRKDNGDTIILYTWGGSIAEDLKTFKKSTNQVGFNIYRYPVKVQNNGTVVVNRMAKQTYVWRSDTLYLLDEYNKSAADAHSKLTNAHWAKEISTEEYKKKLKEFDESKF